MPHNAFELRTESSRKTLEDWQSQIDGGMESLAGELVSIRRHLHQHPEPSGHEVATTRFLADRLSGLGLSPRILREGLGVIADLSIGEPDERTPLIAIRADIDALRIPDQKTTEYASQCPGIMHACGHDAHSTMVLGTAMVAKQFLDNEPGRGGVHLRFLFQPAEEISAGAAWLVDQGVLEGVSRILGVHVDPERLAGTVGIRYGMLTANCDEIDIQVRGRGGHAARPHHTSDPIAASSQLLSSIYGYLPRSVDSRNPSVISIGQIVGGYAPNVIPDSVQIRGSLRTVDSSTRETLKRRLSDICSGVQQSSGCQVLIRFLSPLSGVNNDPEVTAALEEASIQVVGRENVQHIERPSMGGEDFAVYLDHVRGAQLRLGCAVAGKEAPFLHSPHFDLDERSMLLGTRILLRAALLLALAERETPNEG